MNVTETPAVLPGRALAAGDGMAWIGEGWRLFTKAPLMWILSILVILVIEVVLGFVPLLGQIASFLVKPIFFAGLSGPRRSHQIVLSFRASELEQVRWQFRRTRIAGSEAV